MPGKNTKLLAGKPLIQWTIDAAKESGVFDAIFVCSDDSTLRDTARDSGVNFTEREPSDHYEPDIRWVRLALFPNVDAFAILRPTSPFRTAATIQRAHRKFYAYPCSSLRAVEWAKQHPGKMWMQVNDDTQITPLLGEKDLNGVPWHSHPTQALPKVYVQNSSLEMAWTWCVTVFDSISGPKVAPFFTEGMEGFSIDYPEDWDLAEQHAQILLARV